MTNSPNLSSEPRSRNFERLDPRIQRWLWQAGWTSLRDAQEQAIPPLLAGDRDLIIAAATASGKTEAAFLPILTRLAKSEEARLAVYVGPLKALINDQWQRLEGLCEALEIPVTPWHGDITASHKARFLKRPSGCLLITPESLEAMLMRQGSTATGALQAADYFVIDELHSFMGTERGKQLQSLLSRSERLIQRQVPRVGLSATLGDMNGAREFLRPGAANQVDLIIAEQAALDLHILLKGVLVPTADPLKKEEEDESNLMAEAIIVTDLFRALRGSNNLVFPNSRRAVELFADKLRRRCEEEQVPNEFWPHHGNLAKGIREQTEAALKQKTLPATGICTSTLELGIDIGAIKSVAQIGPPPSVASLRQRLGRSGRRKGEPAILRSYTIEYPLTPQSGPSDLLRANLVQTISMIRLLLQGWYEPVSINGLHASTLVQQVLSVISQQGGATAGLLWEILCARGAFAGISQDLFASLLRGLGAKEIILQDATGLLLLAPKGERICGHYSFYAAFSEQEEFRLVAGGQTLGSMPVSRPLSPGSFVIFGGRRWQVISISIDDLVIEVKPGAGGVLPSFEGQYGATIHGRVREEMRQVLRSSEPIPFLDKNGMLLLEEARGNYHRLDLDTLSIRDAGAEVHLFWWQGDRINDTLALLLQAYGLQALNHGIYLEIRGGSMAEIIEILRDLAQTPETPRVASTVQNKIREKWDRLLSEDVLEASFVSNSLDVTGTLEAIRTICM